MPMLAGVPVSDDDTQTLAELLRHAEVVALTIVDRESLLWALDETPTDGLAELRGVLVREHEWRVREGLV